jgi:hypothetical protein
MLHAGDDVTLRAHCRRSSEIRPIDATASAIVCRVARVRHVAVLRRTISSAFVGALLVLVLVPAAAQAATITPTRLDDPPGAGSCPSDCSLRQAITAAGAGGTVSLQPGTYQLKLGPLALKADLTLTGPSAGATSISAGGLSALVTITTAVNVAVTGITLSDGLAPASGSSGGTGGAILNNGVLTLNAVDLVRNAAAGGAPTSKVFGGSGGQGGALFNNGLVTINGGTLAENTARHGSAKFGLETTEFSGGNGQGGAIVNQGTLVAIGATLSANVAEGGLPGTIFGGNGGEGGAIVSFGSARIEGSALTANTAQASSTEGGEGGAIVNFGALNVTGSTLQGNVAAGTGSQRAEGGAIDTFGSTTIRNSTLSGNSAQGSAAEGGAIDAFSSLAITASTLNGNTSGGAGGAVEAFSAFELTNSTIAGNVAGTKGGGLQNSGSSVLANATIAANTAAANNGGNIDSSGASLVLHDTIVAAGKVTGGAGGENCTGTGNRISLGYNAEDRAQCGLNAAGDQTNVANLLLGTLAANGGPTQTIALPIASPAIDAGDPTGCTNALGEPLTTDQRGVHRPQGARCDIGAYEVEQAPVAALVLTRPPAPAIPALSGLRVSPNAFRAAATGATIAKKGKAKAGATISYSDSLAATTTFVIIKPTAGVRSGKRCVAPPRHRAKHKKLKRCTRLLTLGSFSHVDRAGVNNLRFSGRLRAKKLAPATYTLTATPKLGGRAGRKLTAHFTIKR